MQDPSTPTCDCKCSPCSCSPCNCGKSSEQEGFEEFKAKVGKMEADRINAELQAAGLCPANAAHRAWTGRDHSCPSNTPVTVPPSCLIFEESTRYNEERKLRDVNRILGIAERTMGATRSYFNLTSALAPGARTAMVTDKLLIALIMMEQFFHSSIDDGVANIKELPAGMDDRVSKIHGEIKSLFGEFQMMFAQQILASLNIKDDK